MGRLLLAFFLVLAIVAQTADISGDRIREHIKYLASDKLEGRGVGTRGETLATDYIAGEFKEIGAKPAGDGGTYFQKVPMIGAETQPNATLAAVAPKQTVSFQWLNEFVGVSQLQQPSDQFEADA